MMQCLRLLRRLMIVTQQKFENGDKSCMHGVYDPHSGGVKIPAAVKQRTERRIRSYAEAKYAGKFTRLGIRLPWSVLLHRRVH